MHRVGRFAFPEQVRMAPEAVMAVRGLVIGPLRLHQQPLLPQDVKEPIASHFDISREKAAPSMLCSLRVPMRGWRRRIGCTSLTTVCALSRHCRSR